MTIIDDRTTNRDYAKPAGANDLADDVLRLREALDAIDSDIAGLLLAVAARALADHDHSISDVVGLAVALADKVDVGTTYTLDDLSDVAVATATAGQYLRLVAGTWVPATPAISHIPGLQDALDAKLDDSQMSVFGADLIASLNATIARTTLQLKSSALMSDDRVAYGDASATVSADARLVAVNAPLTAPRTLTLPAANAAGAPPYIIIADEARGVTVTNTLTIQRAGSDTINGGTSIVLNSPGGVVILTRDGTSKWTGISTVSDAYTKAEADGRFSRREDIYRNRIVNGGMVISQERGSSSVDVTTGNAYVVDQWLAAVSATPGGTLRAQRIDSFTPGGSPNRLRFSVQAVDASLAASDFYGIFQFIEGMMISDARFGSASARPLVLRMGVRSSIAGTFSVAVRNGALNRAWIGSFTVAAGEVNTDLVRTLVIPGDTTGPWLTDSGVGFSVSICLGSGTTLQGVAGWQAGAGIALPAHTNFMASAGATFELFDVGLYVDGLAGGVIPRWEPSDPADELFRCYRYYVNHGHAEQHYIPAPGATFVSSHRVDFPAPMRAVPSVNPSYYSTNAASANSIPVVSTVGFSHVFSATVSTNAWMFFTWVASARY